jgi:stage II sporulation protein D
MNGRRIAVKRYWLLVLVMILSLPAFATESIKVGLFQNSSISSVIFTVVKGEYQFTDAKGKLHTWSEWKSAKLFARDDAVILAIDGKEINCGLQAVFSFTQFDSEFQLKPVSPSLRAYKFHDNLIVKSRRGKLVLINELDLDKYVSGVVEAEAGASYTKEFYKVQAIISRTYALSNKHRHETEGFHVCDQVHCQVFHGKAQYNDDILFAAYETQNLVLVDHNIKLITAAFHSNCGGRTVNSEEVWSKSLPYLQSVEDTFCLVMSQSNWQRTFLKKDWTEYVRKKQQHAGADSSQSHLSWSPTGKEQFYLGNDNNLRTVDIRKDWRLRSAWFAIEEAGDSIRFMGRGFGHGVGLCQEGAIRRAELGYSYADILHHYYLNVHLIDLRQLEFFREE